jgi:hypothetical protein
MKSQHGLLLALLALALSMAADAHHAFSPVFDESRTISVAGVVTEFRLVNPHAWMTVDVTDEAGNVVQWTVEFGGRLNLTVGGWTDDSIQAGERITVSGNPTHTGSPRLFFRRLVRADGTELVPPGAERIDAIEEERRQRARARAAAADAPARVD